MGLFDGYFDPEHFRDSGGLLGRLLSLQQEQRQYQPGAGFDQALPVPQTPASRLPWPDLTANGQTPSVSQPPAEDPHSQYQALRPILGDHNAMLATVNLETGKSMIAQALANQQKSGSNAAVVGDGRSIASDASPDGVRPGLQYAQGPLLCAAGPFGCAVGGGITAGQAILGAATALLGGAVLNQNKSSVPGNKPAGALTGKAGNEISVVPRTDQPSNVGALVEQGDDKNPCLDRWEREYDRCDKFWRPSTNRYRDACRARADDRLSLCYGNGGVPHPREPAEYDWKDIPRDPVGR